MEKTSRLLGAGVLSCLVFLCLARAALEWGGDLLPIPIWFATASTVCVALIMPRQVRWSVILGGGLAGNILTGYWFFGETLRSVLTPSLSVLVEIVFATFALEHVLGEDGSISRTTRALKVLVIAVISGCLGASIAHIDTASPVIEGQFDSWVRWALGDIVGITVLVPFALAWRLPIITPRHPYVNIEAAGAFTAVVASTVLSFRSDTQLVYLVIPSVVWLAIRFGPRLASPAAVVAVLIGTYSTGRGFGPFANLGDDAVVQVQGFALAVGICALVGGSHAVRAWDDQQQLRAILHALPDVIAVRGRDGELLNSWIPAHLDDAASSLVSASVPSDNPLEHIEPGQLVPTRIVSESGYAFERRTTPIDSIRSLYLFRDVTEQDRLDQALRAQKEMVARSRVDEQTRLGRLLHDGPIQELAAATLLIGLVKHDASSESVDRLTKAEKLTAEAIGDLRSMADILVPPSARAGELGEALSHFANATFSEGTVATTVKDTSKVPIDGDVAETLYLVGREALANVAFHADATQVTVELSSDDASVQMEITDNGLGLPNQTGDGKRHFGVQLMHERIEEQGGNLQITDRATGGVSVRATLPIDARSTLQPTP